MNLNPYKPPNESRNVYDDKLIDWRNFAKVNVLWLTFLGIILVAIMSWLNAQTEDSLPRRYASYDHKLEIHPLPVVLIFTILVVVPNALFIASKIRNRRK